MPGQVAADRGPGNSAFPSGEESIAAGSRCDKAALPAQGCVVMGHTGNHRHTEYFVLEGTHKDPRVSSWSRTGHPQEPQLRAVSKLLLSSARLSCACSPGAPVPESRHSVGKNLSLISHPNLPDTTSGRSLGSCPRHHGDQCPVTPEGIS